MKPVKTLATHNGIFHADELFAVAILKLIYPNIKIIRTRDKGQLKKVDIRVDVGRNYNTATNDFDHHQDDFSLQRNGIPYASAGLIWKHFGKQLVNSDEAFEYIDKKIMWSIDAADNGIQISTANNVEPYTIQKIIDLFNPHWKEKTPDYNKAFHDILKIIITILRKEIIAANSIQEANKLINKAIAQARKQNKKYIILEQYVPRWKEILCNEQDMFFVVYQNPDGNWCVHTIPISKDSFESKKLLPQEWADCTDDKFTKLTGVKDAYFCHKARFIACARSKNGVIALAEMAVKLTDKYL